MENDCYRCYACNISPDSLKVAESCCHSSHIDLKPPPRASRPCLFNLTELGGQMFALAGFMGRFAARGYLFVPFINIGFTDSKMHTYRSMGYSRVHTKLRLLSHTKHDNTYWSKIKAQGGLTNVLVV